jgi:hypothetical protein
MITARKAQSTAAWIQLAVGTLPPHDRLRPAMGQPAVVLPFEISAALL